MHVLIIFFSMRKNVLQDFLTQKKKKKKKGGHLGPIYITHAPKLITIQHSEKARSTAIGTLVVTMPGAWRYWVSAGTGWPGVSIL